MREPHKYQDVDCLVWRGNISNINDDQLIKVLILFQVNIDQYDINIRHIPHYSDSIQTKYCAGLSKAFVIKQRYVFPQN